MRLKLLYYVSGDIEKRIEIVYLNNCSVSLKRYKKYTLNGKKIERKQRFKTRDYRIRINKNRGYLTLKPRKDILKALVRRTTLLLYKWPGGEQLKYSSYVV